MSLNSALGEKSALPYLLSLAVSANGLDTFASGKGFRSLPMANPAQFGQKNGWKAGPRQGKATSQDELWLALNRGDPSNGLKPEDTI